MKRTQHHQITYHTWRCLALWVILLVMLGTGSVYIVKHLTMNRSRVVKKSKQPISRNNEKNDLDKDIFLKNDELAVSLNTQLKDSGYIGTALIVHHNRVILQQGFGYADKEQNRLNNAQSVYQIASIQKGFTATLVMQQVRAGKISLETPLSRYYPNIPNAENITIQQMLTMTSGLTQKVSAKTFTSEAANVQFDADHVSLLASNNWSYQAVNYRLLAGILMQITHKTYSELFNDFFNKHHHLNVSDYKTFVTNSHRTIGYKTTDYSQFNTDNSVAYATETGTGNMAMTTGMLYRYYRLLSDHKLLDVQELNAMWRPADGMKYASGLYHYGDYNTGHGVIMGFESTIVATNNGQDAVILLSNEHAKGAAWQPLAKALFEQMTAIKIVK
ncbi:serine hydrolase domain-containing protein [Leuconostoc rapi]|uniref:serine hydrolase domain-containing protein n=1 Tax=Leuconostoc rapi TaxID=1406906 RepID=UPI00195692B0|nr:serine hydrolase domain-containing protein [Leuconostoc rapi]MBM7436023.1 CubicO group peptidase (beta-lactamase class C family) [Leuconostoc rapi]